MLELHFMIPDISENLSHVRHIIEKLYECVDTFRSIYHDYQTYLDAIQFWEQSTSDDAPAPPECNVS
jgi:nitrate reductase assembly molybdenum cofactor insertion protein NarJ